MLNISGKNIELTRGDTGYVDFVPINADKTEYTIVEGDKVYFRAKAETVLEKQCVAEVGSSIATVCFTPADRKSVV